VDIRTRLSAPSLWDSAPVGSGQCRSRVSESGGYRPPWYEATICRAGGQGRDPSNAAESRSSTEMARPDEGELGQRHDSPPLDPIADRLSIPSGPEPRRFFFLQSQDPDPGLRVVQSRRFMIPSTWYVASHGVEGPPARRVGSISAVNLRSVGQGHAKYM